MSNLSGQNFHNSIQELHPPIIIAQGPIQPLIDSLETMVDWSSPGKMVAIETKVHESTVINCAFELVSLSY